MDKLYKIALPACVLLIHCVISVYPQSSDYKFRHLTTEDGLPSNICYSVIKDHQGFIWISTRNGLCRYDGYNMKVYQYDPHDSTSISDNSLGEFESMVIDKNGNLWFSTYLCVNKYDPYSDSFKRYYHHPDDSCSISSDWIYCLYFDKAGTLWVGTGKQGGLNRYLPEKDEFISYKNNLGDTGGKIPSIYCLYEDLSGIFWVGTADGLYQFDRLKEQFNRIPYVPKSPHPIIPLLIRYINEDVDSTLFLGTQFGYLTFDRIRNKLVPFKPLYDEQKFLVSNGILPQPGNEKEVLWLLDYELHEYDRRTTSVNKIPYEPGNPGSIHGEVLSSFFRDESGVVWIPSEVGVNILFPDNDHIITHDEFSDHYVEPNTFLEDMQGHIWIGTFSLIHFDLKMNLIKEYIFPENKMGNASKITISRIFEDAMGNIWVGTVANGLYLLDREKDELIRCKFSPEDRGVIMDIFEDSHGILWFGTEKGLFQRCVGNDPATDFYQDPAWGILNDSYILCVNEDSNENLWIGTNFSGLFCQTEASSDPTNFLHYTHDPMDDNSLSNDWVWSVYEDIYNNVWVATEHGLNKFINQENHFIRYINDTDLGANFIYDLNGDDNGNLWMTTESGLIRFNPGIQIKDYKTSLRYKRILPFKDIYPYWIYKTKSGEFLLGAAYGSGKGYYSFNPDNVVDNIYLPPVIINNFTVLNNAIHLDTNISLKEHIILHFNQNFFSLEFSALDYTQPEKNQYAYYLEGFDESWVYCNNRRLANYTRVPPGNYVFHVKGSNNDGYWNEQGTSIAITILPPPWKTWWAYMSYAIILLGLIILWRLYDLRRIRLKQQLELEHVEATKLKELDSMKSRFFANISHEFRTPLTLILGPLEKLFNKIDDEESRQDISIVQRNARRLQRLIDQLLSLSKLEFARMKLHVTEENLVDLIRNYIQQFESLARQKNIDLAFHSDRDSISCWVDRDKMEKIMYNLLSNAFKFTSVGGRITVSIIRQKSSVFSRQSLVKNDTSTEDCGLKTEDLLENCTVISISDSGSGIAPVHLPHIFDRFYQADDSNTRDQEGTGIGLALTKELVELHHGTITVNSEVGKGTTFFVLLPLGGGHLREEEMNTSCQSAVISRQSAPTPALSNLDASPPGPLSNLERGNRGPGGEGGEAPLLLIVEDNSDLCLYIRRLLIDDYQVIEASDGQKGFDRAIEHIPDLILSDVMMPEMDGFELCNKIKTDERTSHIPVILLTARAGMESKIEGLETGADDFITKPFDTQELSVRIKNLIELRRRLRERVLKNADKIGLTRLMDMPDSGVGSIDQVFLKKAVAIIEKHLDDVDFTVEIFGQEMAVSQMQLYRKLKALVNLSANEFIRYIRLSHAALLISRKSGNIAQISYAVGFNNPSYFAECFKKQFGVLPSEYLSDE